MKRAILLTLILSIASLCLFAWAAPPDPQGTEVTMQGEIVDLWCYLEGDLRGLAHKACSSKCARAGKPIGFLDVVDALVDAVEDNNLYVLTGVKDYQSVHEGRDMLIEKMNEQVEIKGILVKKNGLDMIYVESVEYPE